MANNLGIEERTLAEVADSTNTINLLNQAGDVAASPRKSWNQNILVRISDHADNDGGETDDPDLMAIFHSHSHMQPWKKDANVLEHITHEGAAPPSNVSVLFPDFDYGTTE